MYIFQELVIVFTMIKRKIPVFKADVLGNAQEVNKIFNMFSRFSVLVTSRIGEINQILAIK